MINHCCFLILKTIFDDCFCIMSGSVQIYVLLAGFSEFLTSAGLKTDLHCLRTVFWFVCSFQEGLLNRIRIDKIIAVVNEHFQVGIKAVCNDL